MAEIRNVNGRPVIDYIARDYESFLHAMRSQIPSKLPEWTDYESEADFGNVLLQLFAHMGDILSYYQDRLANESFLATAQSRRSIIQHLRLIGYRLSTAAPASATLTLLVSESVRQPLIVQNGFAFATKSTREAASVRFEYTRRVPLTINPTNLPTTADTTDKRLRYFGPNPFGPPRIEDLPGIPVQEGRLVTHEILGTSDGTRGQTFQLAHASLILRSFGEEQRINDDITIVTEVGGLVESWTLRDTLAFSRDNQRDFTLQIDEHDRTTIMFGDGAFGAIPPPGSVIKATYRYGGGEHGNVGPQTINTLVDAGNLPQLGVKIINARAATGGADRESIAHAVEHAPFVYRSQRRAVTADDYRRLALDFHGVGKVRAEATGLNRVVLYVAPQGGGLVSDVLRDNLLAFFEDKRSITTTIEIQNVEYEPVYVTARIGVHSYYDDEEVKAAVQARAGQLLDFEEVEFGTVLYISKFYEAIEEVDGVEFVNIEQFKLQDGVNEVKPDGRLTLSEGQIPVVPAHADYAGGIRVVIDRQTV